MNQVDPVLWKLAVRPEEVVGSVSVRDVPAEDSPPRSISSLRARCRPLAFVLTSGHSDGPLRGACWSRSPCPAPESDGPARDPIMLGGQGLHAPDEPPLPAMARNPARHPRTSRPAKAPAEARFSRRSAYRVRQRALQETQHHRTRRQRLPRCRHRLRDIYLGTVTLAALVKVARGSIGVWGLSLLRQVTAVRTRPLHTDVDPAPS